MASDLILGVQAELQMALRLALAAGLAAVMGMERQFGQQPAGLRTHMLVSLGAAAFTVAGMYGVSPDGSGVPGAVRDPGRIAAQIVTGIGFLGAGTIWRSGSERVIRGLTTAASIWVAAAVGMLCGFGLYILATTCALLGFAVLHTVRRLERSRLLTPTPAPLRAPVPVLLDPGEEGRASLRIAPRPAGESHAPPPL